MIAAKKRFAEKDHAMSLMRSVLTISIATLAEPVFSEFAWTRASHLKTVVKENFADLSMKKLGDATVSSFATQPWRRLVVGTFGLIARLVLGLVRNFLCNDGFKTKCLGV